MLTPKGIQSLLKITMITVNKYFSFYYSKFHFNCELHENKTIDVYPSLAFILTDKWVNRPNAPFSSCYRSKSFNFKNMIAKRCHSHFFVYYIQTPIRQKVLMILFTAQFVQTQTEIVENTDCT